MSYAHLSVTLQYSPQFEVKYKRRNFATPKNYLDFLSNYMKFLENNRNSLDQMSGAINGRKRCQFEYKLIVVRFALILAWGRLGGGLDKLVQAAVQVRKCDIRAQKDETIVMLDKCVEGVLQVW